MQNGLMIIFCFLGQYIFWGNTILLSSVKIVKRESIQDSVAKLSQAEPMHGDMAHDKVVTCQKTVE